jgi:hypothetical protein
VLSCKEGSGNGYWLGRRMKLSAMRPMVLELELPSAPLRKLDLAFRPVQVTTLAPSPKAALGELTWHRRPRKSVRAWSTSASQDGLANIGAWLVRQNRSRRFEVEAYRASSPLYGTSCSQ